MGFWESVDNARIGERVVYDFLNSSEKVKSVIDVRKDERFMKKDIDFLVYNTNKKVFYVEVKSDFMAHETKNMAYELYTSGNEGCIPKSESDYIYYYVVKSKTLYIMPTKKLNNFVSDRIFPLRKMGHCSEGYLIPFEILEKENVVIKKIENLD